MKTPAISWNELNEMLIDSADTSNSNFLLQYLRRFEDVVELGVGGNAKTFLARHRELNTKNVLRVVIVRDDDGFATDLQDKYLNEARKNAMETPFLTPVYDYVVAKCGGVALHVSVLPLARGVLLSEWLANRRQHLSTYPEADTAMKYCADSFRVAFSYIIALQEQTRRGFVHGDPHEKNVILQSHRDRVVGSSEEVIVPPLFLSDKVPFLNIYEEDIPKMHVQTVPISFIDAGSSFKVKDEHASDIAPESTYRQMSKMRDTVKKIVMPIMNLLGSNCRFNAVFEKFDEEAIRLVAQKLGCLDDRDPLRFLLLLYEHALLVFTRTCYSAFNLNNNRNPLTIYPADFQEILDSCRVIPPYVFFDFRSLINDFCRGLLLDESGENVKIRTNGDQYSMKNAQI